MTSETIRNCKICDKPTKTGCSRCKSVFYCSQDCQAADWADHAPICTEAWRQQKAQKKAHESAAAAAAMHGVDFAFNRKRPYAVASQHYLGPDKDLDLKDGIEQPKRKKIKWNCEPYLSTMRNAVRVCIEGQSTTKTAGEFGIPARTLRRYVANERRKRSQMAAAPSGLYAQDQHGYGPGPVGGGNFRGPLGYPAGGDGKLGPPSNLLGGAGGDRSAFSRALDSPSGLYPQDSLYYGQQRHSTDPYMKGPSDGFPSDFNSSWPAPAHLNSQNLQAGNSFGYSSYLNSTAPKPYAPKPVSTGWPPKPTDRNLYNVPSARPPPQPGAVLARGPGVSNLQGLPPGVLPRGPPTGQTQPTPDKRALQPGLLRQSQPTSNLPPTSMSGGLTLTQPRLMNGSTAGSLVSRPIRNDMSSGQVGRLPSSLVPKSGASIPAPSVPISAPRNPPGTMPAPGPLVSSSMGTMHSPGMMSGSSMGTIPAPGTMSAPGPLARSSIGTIPAPGSLTANSMGSMPPGTMGPNSLGMMPTSGNLAASSIGTMPAPGSLIPSSIGTMPASGSLTASSLGTMPTPGNLAGSAIGTMPTPGSLTANSMGAMATPATMGTGPNPVGAGLGAGPNSLGTAPTGTVSTSGTMPAPGNMSASSMGAIPAPGNMLPISTGTISKSGAMVSSSMGTMSALGPGIMTSPAHVISSSLPPSGDMPPTEVVPSLLAPDNISLSDTVSPPTSMAPPATTLDNTAAAIMPEAAALSVPPCSAMDMIITDTGSIIPAPEPLTEEPPSAPVVKLAVDKPEVTPEPAIASSIDSAIKMEPTIKDL